MKLRLFVKTFEKNEFRSILGKGKSNFWILLIVFLCSIGALCFSRAGMQYLKYKMEDPFINWVEIRKQGNFDRFKDDITRTEELKDSFSINVIEANNYVNEYVAGTNINKPYFAEGQTIAYDSRLLARILDEENAVIVREEKLQANDYGWIVTQELMERLGFDSSERYPLIITESKLSGDTVNEKIEEWHIPVNNKRQLVIPIPVIAVVRQLPSMLDFIVPKYYYNQWNDKEQPFNILHHPDYFEDLKFVVEDTSLSIVGIRRILDKQGINYDRNFEVKQVLCTLRPSFQVRIAIYDSSIANINDAAKSVVDNLKDVYRVYDYFFDNGMELETDYISVMFNDLSMVSDFAKWVKNEYGIKIDMTQIEAKKNFEIFSILIGVLCVAIILLSILFVSIFLWFLIDSHFKAISKNLGTIMAFGLPNKTIIKIYGTVFLKMILWSLAIAFAILGAIELILLSLGVTREGGIEYISLMDWVIGLFVVVVPLLTVLVINFTMKQKLQATPGDLIFERTN